LIDQIVSQQVGDVRSWDLANETLAVSYGEWPDYSVLSVDLVNGTEQQVFESLQMSAAIKFSPDGRLAVGGILKPIAIVLNLTN
jgi:hypothetical protein